MDKYEIAVRIVIIIAIVLMAPGAYFGYMSIDYWQHKDKLLPAIGYGFLAALCFLPITTIFLGTGV